MRIGVVAAAIAAVFLLCCAAAGASPVATSDSGYTVLGRVFPDPLAGCQHVGTKPCSPERAGQRARGASSSSTSEFIDG